MSGILIGAVFDGMAEGQRRTAVPEGVQSQLDLEFAKAGSRSLKLDLYAPPTEPGKTNPAVVWIFPGAWMGGSRKGGPAVALSGHGYVVASIDYRLSQEAKFPAQIEDCKAAVRWLRANAAKYSIDPDRIGVWGASAGGHLAALLGTSGGVAEFDVGENLGQSSSVKAVVDWFGPTDFAQMAAHKPAGSRFDYGSAGSPEGRLVGGPISEHMDLVQKANPVTFIGPRTPPFLIVHGDQDNVVPYHQSQLLHEALDAKQLPNRFVTLENSGHGTGAFNTPAAFDQVLAFFDEHLQRKDTTKVGQTESTKAEECGRDCLIGHMERYLDALVKHDPQKLPLAAQLKSTENGLPSRLGEGAWKSATAIKTQQYFADPAAGQVAFAGAIEEGETPAILFVRLKLESAKIVEVETIVAHRGDHALFSPQSLIKENSVYNETVSANQRTPRKKMIAAADSYFDGIEKHNGADVPFAPGCTRVENGVQMAGGPGRSIADGMRAFTYIPKVRDRRYPIVDEERGTVVSVIVFDMPGNAPSGGLDEKADGQQRQRAPRSLLLVEVFKVVEGKLVAIDTYMVNRTLGAPSGW